MLYSSLTHGWGERQRTILVTSVAPQEGKTLIAANLAVTFAREGARVLLVDSDLRRPRLHKIFRVSRAPGLADLLNPERSLYVEGEPAQDDGRPAHAYSMMPELERPTGKAEAEAAPPEAGPRTTQRAASRALPKSTPIRPTSIKNLSLLPCGSLSLHHAEVLTAGGFRSILQNIASEFDVIILDTPPVLVSADAVILSPIADGVLMVVRAGQTHRDAAELAYQQLTSAGASVIGAVLNDPAGELDRERKYYYQYEYPATRE